MREAERREDGRGVGGGDDGAEQHGLELGEIEEHVRGDAGQDGADDDADGAQQRRRHRDLAQTPPRGLQAALVEDQREPDDADLPRELRVVELDPARAVGAEQHPDRQERREHGQPRSCSTERDEDAARQNAADEQKQKTLVHASIFPVRERPFRGLGERNPLPRIPILRSWKRSHDRRVEHFRMATRPRTRKMGRLSEIAQVAVRHGFGYFFERHKLTDILPWTARVEAGAESAAGSERGRHLREMLDELGPTFVKFGQLLSTRPDVVPPDIVAELRGLQDDVSPFPFAQVREVVESELGLTLEQAFIEFGETPIAAASIGQVHRAVLPNGDQVDRQGAAAERAESDRERPRPPLPGRPLDQGARPRARLHRRQRPRRRVRALHPPGARLQARGAARRHVQAQLRGHGRRSSCPGSTGTTPACGC